MKVSVIFTTYNQAEWLEKVLWGFSAQTYKPCEVVVADDGSRADTKEVIEKMRAATGLEIIHIWHPDDGFRKCEILNKAIVRSTGEYLIFTDGDCIPPPHFIANHVRFSEKGYFLSGGYIKLPMSLSKSLTRDDILSGHATDPVWLAKHGMGWNPKLLKLTRSEFLANLLNKITTTKATWNGHSSSTWRQYIFETNGFDMRMQYGGQDREFGERLMNMGIKGKQVRYHCATVHLDHKRGYATKESIQKNRSIRKQTEQERIKRTSHGISELGDF